MRGKECASPLAQTGETVDFKVVRGEMAKLEPRWITETFLGRTDESDEVIVGTAAGIELARSFRRRTSNKQWERDALTTFIGVPWNPRGLAVEAPMASNKRRYITKAIIRQHGETPGCAACLGTASQHTAKCRKRFERLINPSATDEILAAPGFSSGWRRGTRTYTHWKQLVGTKALKQEDTVSHDTENDARRGKYKAVNCCVTPSTANDDRNGNYDPHLEVAARRLWDLCEKFLASSHQGKSVVISEMWSPMEDYCKAS